MGKVKKTGRERLLRLFDELLPRIPTRDVRELGAAGDAERRRHRIRN